MKNIKPKSLLISIGLAIILFVGLIFVEKSLLKPNGTVDGFIATNDIEKGTLVTEDNISNLFKKKNDIDGELEVEGAIKNEEELINQIVNESINKGEVISANRFIGKDNKLKDIKNPVETSFNVSDISQVVGGILREGDLIDISVVDNNTSESTQVLKSVYVTKAISSDGKEIDRSSDISALTINLILSEEDEAKLNSYINSGIIRASKRG